MIHARTDYDRIQDPALHDPSLLSEGSSPIGEDEPVFLIRANDHAFVDAVNAWIKSHLDAGGDHNVAVAVGAHLGRAIAWREKNGAKLADAPDGVLKRP